MAKKLGMQALTQPVSMQMRFLIRTNTGLNNMKTTTYKIVPASYLILKKDGKILLLRRFNTGYHDGDYSLIAGHLDGAETFREAMAREAQEEIGVKIDPSNLKVVHVMHRFEPDNPPEIKERIDVFTTTATWEGEPKNMEPKKCDDLKWFDRGELPDNMIPYIKFVLQKIEDNVFYSEFGFDS